MRRRLAIKLAIIQWYKKNIAVMEWIFILVMCLMAGMTIKTYKGHSPKQEETILLEIIDQQITPTETGVPRFWAFGTRKITDSIQIYQLELTADQFYNQAIPGRYLEIVVSDMANIKNNYIWKNTFQIQNKDDRDTSENAGYEVPPASQDQKKE